MSRLRPYQSWEKFHSEAPRRSVFKDGEVVVGTTQGYERSRPGLFVIPVDTAGNNERCFVVAAATQEVSFV
jgi:hypothetical protein